MGQQTLIAWTSHTFNVAWGCVKVSPGCANCYAENFATNRAGLRVWGKDAPRRTFGEKHWNEPRKWNREAERAGERRRVFCSSMCDVFEDHSTIAQERAKLWPLIEATPWLDWQLLTKRPERIAECLPASWGAGWFNVWLGTSIENNDYVSRADHLRRVPATVRFISYEPALGPLDKLNLDGLDWILYGGESGPKRRPEDKAWARQMRKLCGAETARRAARGDPSRCEFFHKQSAGPRTEMGIELDGEIVRPYPTRRLALPQLAIA